MTDSQNERLFNAFNRVTKVTKDTYIEITTAMNVMNAAEPGLNCTEKGLISALNEYNYSIVDTLLGRHRLIGIDIRPEYVQYLTAVDKMYRKANPSIVANFLYKDETLKHILDTHVAKAKSPKYIISKDQMVKLLSGYARRFPDTKATLSNIYNDQERFIYAMHQYFGVDLVEETNNKWYIRGWVPKYEYIGTRPIELDWQSKVVTVEELTAALIANAEDSATSDTEIQPIVKTEPEPVTITPTLTQVEQAEAKVTEPLDLEKCITLDGMSDYEKMYVRPAYAFFEWLTSVSKFTNSVNNSIGETRMLKAYRYYLTNINPKGEAVREAKTARIIKSILTLKDYKTRYGCKIPEILNNVTMDNAKRNMSIIRWTMPPDMVTVINNKVSEVTQNQGLTSTSANASNVANNEPTPVLDECIGAPSKSNLTKPEEKIPRRMVALAKQMAICNDDTVSTKLEDTGYERRMIQIFKSLGCNEIGVKCYNSPSGPTVDFIARKIFGMSRINMNYYQVILIFADDFRSVGTVGLKMSFADKTSVTFPEDAYPYGFSISGFLEDLIKMIDYYSSVQ